MLNKKVQKALNDQINAELYSAYLYLAMSNWFVLENLPGMANWLKVQAEEELSHAMRIYNFVQDRNSQVVLEKIEGPPLKWSSPVAAFEAAYQHEQKITGMINDIVDAALAERDHATVSFLNWFVDEQVEEEASALEVVDKLKMVEGHAGSMFMVDKELGQRVSEPEGEE